MDWFLHDRDHRHKRVNHDFCHYRNYFEKDIFKDNKYNTAMDPQY